MAKRPRKVIRRKVLYRFRNIDRSTSKSVYELESQLALARRELKRGAKALKKSRIQEIYHTLVPRHRRALIEYGYFLLGTSKKKG